MDEYLSLNIDKRGEIKEKIKEILLWEKDIIFSFIFGSFLDSPSFRDIDIAVYIKEIEKGDIFDYELKISEKIATSCGLPFDIFEIKVLNFSPNSFLNNVFSKGQILFSKNYQLLSDMIENTSKEAIANEYISYQSLKELVPG